MFWRACALSLLLASVPAIAQVQRLTGYQGRLLRADGTAATGTATVTFLVYAADTGGTPLWQESQTLGLSDGYYSTFLGLVATPSESLFDGAARWLEVRVGGETLAPRQQIGSVAYAVTARNLAGGAADVTSLKVAGQTVVDASGRLAGSARYAAGSGLDIDDATQVISLEFCASGQALVRDDSTWQCAPMGTMTAVNVASPLVATGPASAPTISMIQASTTSAGYLSSTDWNSFNARYGASTQCGGDLSGPLSAPTVTRLQSRPVSANEPGNGHVLKWNAATSRWEPSPDLNSGGTVTGVIAVAPLSAQNGTTNAELSIGPASAAADGYLASSDFAAFQAKYGSTTVCGGDLDGTLASPVVAKIQGIQVVTTIPSSAQVLRYDGSRWAPASLGISDVGGLSTGYVDLSTSQSISGSKWFDAAPSFGAPLSVSSGGTGASTLSGVVHGTGTDVLTAGAVSLATEVSGTLAVANGGTGASSLSGVVHGSGTGALTAGAVSLATEVSGTLAIANGGTGATTAAANAFFAGPNGSTGAPSFRTLVLADIPTLDATKIPGLDASKIATGTLPLARGGTGAASSPSAGSVLFGGTGGLYAQSNASFYWNDTTGRLGIGTSTPSYRLDVQGGDATVSGAVRAASFWGSGANLTGVVAAGVALPVDGATDTACSQAGILRWNGSHFQGCTGVYWANLDNVPPPNPTSVSPVRGPTAGNNTVTIWGSNFQALARIFFGTAEATGVSVQSASKITLTAPAGAAGTVDVKVTNPDFLAGTLGAAYTYVLPPSVAAVNPATGATRGGVAITITGSNFAGSTVTVGGAPATSVVVNPTVITAVTPSSASAGAAAVTVTNDDGQQSGSSFTYQASGESSALAVAACSSLLSINGGSAGSTTYYVNPIGTGAFKVYCDMTTWPGQGWTVIAYAPTRTIGLTYSMGSTAGTVGDLSGGWNQMPTFQALATGWFTRFRGYYRYYEDQPSIPQTGQYFTPYIDYVSKGGNKAMNQLVSSGFTSNWTVATSEGSTTCSSFYSLFSFFWDTLATGASGGSGGHSYCGFYGPGQSYEGYCSQAYAVNQCNRAGYGKFTWAWYMVR